jgi:hypothetical protein
VDELPSSAPDHLQDPLVSTLSQVAFMHSLPLLSVSITFPSPEPAWAPLLSDSIIPPSPEPEMVLPVSLTGMQILCVNHCKFVLQLLKILDYRVIRYLPCGA